jgi:hypothetical protein
VKSHNAFLSVAARTKTSSGSLQQPTACAIFLPQLGVVCSKTSPLGGWHETMVAVLCTQRLQVPAQAVCQRALLLSHRYPSVRTQQLQRHSSHAGEVCSTGAWLPAGRAVYMPGYGFSRVPAGAHRQLPLCRFTGTCAEWGSGGVTELRTGVGLSRGGGGRPLQEGLPCNWLA